jgi:FkbM family methyltransferase
MRNIFEFVKLKLKFWPKKFLSDKIEIYLTKYLTNLAGITIVDVGANRGHFVAQIEKHYSINNAILIEPIPELADHLKLMFTRENFYIYQNVLSDKDRFSIEFQVNEFAETSSVLDFDTKLKELANVNTKLARKELASTRTLDSIITELKLPNIDLIKIDVQGIEHLVIRGGRETLTKTRFIWVELSFKPLYVGSSVFQDIYQLMNENGFILLEISPGHRSPINELLQADALFANRELL